jgi:hypothetical protein
VTSARWVIILVGLGAMSACGDSRQLPSDPPDIGSSPAGVGEWGPLAIWDDSGVTGGDMARLAGELMIGEHCVTVGGTTLVWGASQTRWMADGRTIQFHDPLTDAIVELADGDQVELGGGQIGDVMPWVAQPHGTCPAEAFGVGNLGSVNGIEP